MANDVRSFFFHGTLALCGLALAWWATRQPHDATSTPGQSVIVACRGLQEVRFVAGPRQVKVLLTKGHEQVSLTRPVAPVLPGNATRTESLVMQANARVERLRSRLSPMMARRSLGTLSPQKLASLGLDKSTESLRVICRDGSHAFAIGAASYGGSGRYIKDARGGVWLVDPTLISDVRLADSRYVERRLVDAKRAELQEITLRVDQRSITLKHLDAHNTKRATWVNAKHPNRRNETYGNWIAKLLQARALTWLAQDSTPTQELPSGQSLRRVFEATVRAEREIKVELVHSQGPKNKRNYWAKSDATGGWVTLSRRIGQQLSEDLEGLLNQP